MYACMYGVVFVFCLYHSSLSKDPNMEPSNLTALI